MFNHRHLTHVLLIDKESVAELRALVQNAGDLLQQFSQLAGSSSYHSYTLVIVFCKSRGDLDEPAEEFAVQIKNLGAKCCVNSVAEADMFLIKGKAGLLACSLWSIAGATLVNDQPIPVMYAESILSLANRHEGIYPIGKGAHAALIANQTSIGPALLKLPQDHTLAELVQAISRGDGSGRSAPAKKKGWWPF